jgi:myo-inositol-1(or 4)-monophosphatase
LAADDVRIGGNESDLALLERKVRAAGDIAMRYFNGENRVWTKDSDSPVSEADLAVDRYLHDELRAARSEYGWLSEETADSPERLERGDVFVVDPIDGTRGFLRGEPDWCISVAIVSGGIPRSAVLYCPPRGQTFAASHGGGAWLNGRRLAGGSRTQARKLTGSRRINQAIASQFPQRFEVHPFLPSLAYRLALVAAGEIDGAFASAGSHEWDVAAADLVLSEAGGRLTTPAGLALRYNKKRVGMPALVASSANLHEQLLDIAKSGGFLH